MVEQHVKVTVEFSSNNRVAIRTPIGWLNSFKMEIDAVNLDDARNSTIKLLDSLELVPYENCSSNEEFIEPAKVAVDDAIRQVSSMTSWDNSSADTVPNSVTLIKDVINITVDFTDSYSVHFN